jgi:hypothetical protein
MGVHIHIVIIIINNLITSYSLQTFGNFFSWWEYISITFLIIEIYIHMVIKISSLVYFKENLSAYQVLSHMHHIIKSSNE